MTPTVTILAHARRHYVVTTIDQTEARLNTHEEVCALRYDGLCARLKRIEGLGITVAGAIIMLLVSIIMKMN